MCSYWVSTLCKQHGKLGKTNTAVLFCVLVQLYLTNIFYVLTKASWIYCRVGLSRNLKTLPPTPMTQVAEWSWMTKIRCIETEMRNVLWETESCCFRKWKQMLCILLRWQNSIWCPFKCCVATASRALLMGFSCLVWKQLTQTYTKLHLHMCENFCPKWSWNSKV